MLTLLTKEATGGSIIDRYLTLSRLIQLLFTILHMPNFALIGTGTIASKVCY